MRPNRVIARSLLMGALLAGAAAPAAAQSLFANRGLGLVVQPADARAQALGGVEQGLLGGELSWSNPAEMVGVLAPALRMAFQYDGFDAEFGGRSAEGSTARFPLLQLATPVGERWALSLGFGGFLDQNWAVQRDTALLVGGDTVDVLDRLTSEGGVARLRAGVGYRIATGLAVGVGVDLHTGSVRRNFGRQFPNEAAPGCCGSEWQYSGVGMLGGVAWNPSEAFSVSASASYGGTLDAEPRDSLSSASSFDLPMTVQAGASGRVAPNLMLALGTDWSRWSGLDARLAGNGGARDSWTVRGGVEWDGITFRDRAVPIRLGARQAALPFSFGQASAPGDFATERALTGGVGLILAGGAALGDVAVERGSRGGDGAGVDESFWRVLFSVTVLGR